MIPYAYTVPQVEPLGGRLAKDGPLTGEKRP
jgi:hypothetical protein